MGFKADSKIHSGGGKERFSLQIWDLKSHLASIFWTLQKGFSLQIWDLKLFFFKIIGYDKLSFSLQIWDLKKILPQKYN